VKPCRNSVLADGYSMHVSIG